MRHVSDLVTTEEFEGRTFGCTVLPAQDRAGYWGSFYRKPFDKNGRPLADYMIAHSAHLLCYRSTTGCSLSKLSMAGQFDSPTR